MKNTLITVVIPVYNRENHIRACLKMVTGQSYKNLEIIVVDDGSSDKSIDIAEEFTVKIIKHEFNKGLAAARNTGIDNANGKYIHFMDDDDLINTNFYENLVEAAENSDADMACCNFVNQKFMSKSQLFSAKKIYKSVDEKFTATFVGKNGYCVRYLFKNEFLKKNNLKFEEGRFIEDLPFSFKAVYYANKIVTAPNSEYIYVYNDNSILNSISEEKRKRLDADFEHSRKLIYEFAKKHNFKIPAIESKRSKYIFKKIRTALYFCYKYKTLKYLRI